MILIPMGVLCDAKKICNCVHKCRSTLTLPFDWCQMNGESMVKVLNLSDSAIKPFWTTYLSNLNSNNKNKATGSWFPHDFLKDKTTLKFESLEECIEKYSRRTRRMFYNLRLPEDKLLFSFFLSSLNKGNIATVMLLKKCIEDTVPQATYITINALSPKHSIPNHTDLSINKSMDSDHNKLAVRALEKWEKDNTILFKQTCEAEQ